MHYRRARISGTRYFFTVVTARRRPLFDDPAAVDTLRHVFRQVKRCHPFDLDAIVILPDHLHCIWTLPDNDSDYPIRWLLIKSGVTRTLHKQGVAGPIWQNRYWEHCIRDNADLATHVDYIHYNPVKHGLVTSPHAWPWSSFGKWVKRGHYPEGWGEHAPAFDIRVGME